MKFVSSSLPRFRTRRVVVKVHIARARGKSRAGAFRAHLSYLQRDGVDRDGAGGDLYTRESGDVDQRRFLKNSQSDRHQFRIIVSPEDGHAFEDLKSNTRTLMTQMENDLGQKLDWVAVDHHNTGHPHTHIVIRGRDGRGRDLVIARNYLTQGLRERAEELATLTLGPRRDLEIIRAQQSEVSQDRFTGLDRKLAELERDHRIVVAPASGAQKRFRSNLHLRRLAHLRALHLAEPVGPQQWQMKRGWDETLKTMGRRGDVIRSLAAEHRTQIEQKTLKFWGDRSGDEPALLGEVLASGPDDELRDRRFIIVRDFEGTTWHVPGGEDLALQEGAIIAVQDHAGVPRPADRTIDKIAERSGGYYSDDLHAAYDPSSTAAYREAHKRRLEALRRAGLVERQRDGTWDIPDDYLKRVAAFERTLGVPKIVVKSWLSIADQIESHGPVWLDRLSADETPMLGGAIEKRHRVLKARGSLDQKAMAQAELHEAAKAHAVKTGEIYHPLSTGDQFRGRYQGHLDLGQGRVALLSNGKVFSLVPWRRDLTHLRGRDLSIERTRSGISFSITRARTRGLSR
ncbi:MAG: DUF3363 domain-containing protein [Hyphomonadaceae bacterium]|nr:DUF3363 domain-containing protein [Hyphomonadaceae bacterium]